jgi:His-Xaa-Ser system radical SAM maturase HxsC
VTERCNHFCLMCSQPPRNVNDEWILDEIAECLPLIDPATVSLGFTGGEPLLDWRRFIPLLDLTRTMLPDTRIHVLTNGRAFANPEVATAWARVGHQSLCAGIPIYSAIDHIHDYIVQARGAFNETVLGILRLKDKGQRVEIRVVLHRVTAPRLLETCEWIARNLPFVDHVALMGLENTGFAIANEDLLWIDPVDYRDDLTTGVGLLSAMGIHVSVRCIICPSVFSITGSDRSRCSRYLIGRMRICRCAMDARPALSALDFSPRDGCVRAEAYARYREHSDEDHSDSFRCCGNPLYNPVTGSGQH